MYCLGFRVSDLAFRVLGSSLGFRAIGVAVLITLLRVLRIPLRTAHEPPSVGFRVRGIQDLGCCRG